jgi:hypothetical protein
VIYIALFVGVFLTALGSAYYHWNPNNNTLLWDRVPMTIVFMSLLSATLAELASRRTATLVFWPLITFGIVSVLWWHHTETIGMGDLRPYILAQFFPAVAIPLLLCLFYEPAIKPVILSLALVVVWYAASKLFELLDRPIYHLLGLSGHTLKHIAAAVSTWYFVVLFRLRHGRARGKGEV